MYLISILLLLILLTSCCGPKDVTPSTHIDDSRTQKPLNIKVENRHENDQGTCRLLYPNDIEMEDRYTYDHDLCLWLMPNGDLSPFSATELIEQLFQEMYDSKSEPTLRNIRPPPTMTRHGSFSHVAIYELALRKYDETMSPGMLWPWYLLRESSSIKACYRFAPNEIADICFKVDKTKMNALLDAMKAEAKNPKRKSLVSFDYSVFFDSDVEER